MGANAKSGTSTKCQTLAMTSERGRQIRTRHAAHLLSAIPEARPCCCSLRRSSGKALYRPGWEEERPHSREQQRRH